MKPTSDNGRIVGLSGNRFCLVGKGLLMIPAGRQCSFWSSDGVLGNRPVPPPALPISPDIVRLSAHRRALVTDAVSTPLLPHAGWRVELAPRLVVAGLKERGCCGAGRPPAGNPLGEGFQEAAVLAQGGSVAGGERGCEALAKEG